MKKLPEAIEFPAAFWGGRFVKLRFVEAFDGWIFTRMIVVIVTSFEPSALSIEQVSVFDANAHRLRWMASHWMLSRLRLPALQFACSPLARFAGLTLKGSVSLISQSPAAPYEISSLATPEGAASFLAPPPGWQRT